MLILSRKTGESVIIDGRIVVTVTRVDGDVVRLGIQAPEDVPVHRREVYEEIQRNNRQAVTKRRQKVPKLPAAPGHSQGATAPEYALVNTEVTKEMDVSNPNNSN